VVYASNLNGVYSSAAGFGVRYLSLKPPLAHLLRKVKITRNCDVAFVNAEKEILQLLVQRAGLRCKSGK
jgi:hypothetical protein